MISSRYYLSNASLTKLVSFVFWNLIYFLTVTYSDKRSPEWCSRILALLHGSVAVAIGFTQCEIRNMSPYYLSTKLMPWHYLLMVWSWGYFAFDLLWCLLYWSQHHVMLCHHGTALFAITRYMQKTHTGCTFACMLLVLEMTNPLLQTRWFLKHAGLGKSKLYFLTEFLYLSLFLALRGVLGTIAMYWVLTTDFFDLEEKILSTALYVVSLIFIYDICCYVRYKYKRELKDMEREFFYATQIVLTEEKQQRIDIETLTKEKQQRIDIETQTQARSRFYFCSML